MVSGLPYSLRALAQPSAVMRTIWPHTAGTEPSEEIRPAPPELLGAGLVTVQLMVSPPGWLSVKVLSPSFRLTRNPHTPFVPRRWISAASSPTVPP